MRSTLFLAASALALAAVQPALAQSASDDPVFTLGEVRVTASSHDGELIGVPAIVTAPEIAKFSKESLDRTLDLVPGAVAANSGGTRNEQLVFIRGFDRFQTTLSIDGVRVYLPADNRLDFGRFLTADLSEIQVAKGYVSVLDGPGAIGGAINLVTRKPSKPFELEARLGATFDQDFTANGYLASGVLGVRRDKGYLQVSASRLDRDHWALPDDFTPTPNENGGFRDNSAADDWRVNVKAGWTPNETDEYSLSYTRQEGSKEAPYHVSDSLSAQRYWDWPYWNISSVYFLSNTKIGATGYVKTKAYYNTFTNGLFSYDDAAQTIQASPRSFRSYYDDHAYGGDVEAGVGLGAVDTLKAAFHYRRDRHKEDQDLYKGPASAPSSFREPPQHNLEDTFSVALENTLRLGQSVDFVAGVSYDWRDLKKAEEFTLANSNDFTSGSFFSYPLADSDAWNGQAALNWRVDERTKLYASISDRTRFPTIFERFSSRFGGAISNPNLKPERALNLEVGGSTELGDAVKLEGAIFHSDLKDAIASVPFVYQGTNVTQSRNVGKGEYYGFETSVTARVSASVSLGANYTYLHRHLKDPTNAAFHATGTPRHKAFAYADIRPTAKLTLTPSVEATSDRWTATSNGARYYRTGRAALVNFGAAYQLTDAVELTASARNLFDRSYTLVDGFPEEGRSFQLAARLRL